GKSCSVNLITGQWADFHEDKKGGDLVSLYAASRDLPMGKAALQVARDEGLEDVAGVTRSDTHKRIERPPPPPAAPKPRPDEGWTTVRPVPSTSPPVTFKHHYRKPEDIEHTATYRCGDDVHGYVVRFRTSDGGKETLPRTWCMSARDGASKWHWRQFDEPRPLYLPGGALPDGRTVVLVEGEVKAEVLQQLLDAGSPNLYTVASWPGGCKAWKKADWSWLAGSTVLLWPDCDSKREPLTRAVQTSVVAQAMEQLDKIGGEITETDRKRVADTALELAARQMPFLDKAKQPGMSAMLGIGAHLRDQHGCRVDLLQIPEPGGAPDGWDCKDAIKTDGWDHERVLAWFGWAQPLQQTPAADAPAEPSVAAGGGGGGGKKIDSLADAGDDGPSRGGGRGPDWLMPFWNKKKYYWMVSRELVIAALENDQNLIGLMAMNKLTNNIDLRRPLPRPAADLSDLMTSPAGSSRSNHYLPAGPMTGATDLLLGRYLCVKYG
ncbi:MAG: hypothetical protein B7Z52_03310, partial [Burkholderiales bacterium 12-64-5]